MEHDDADDRLAVFERERPRLMGISYRVLGSVTDAEDVLQEAWLRWSAVDLGEVRSPQAMLTTITTRLSIDRLRRAQTSREVYSGPWLPEPVVPTQPDPSVDPPAAAELADSLSMALLVVLETLSPLERAAFVLREVFDYPYPEVSRALERAEPAVRQLVSRARARVEDGRVRFEADRTRHAEVIERFLAACEGADFESLLAVLAPDVVLVSDGGGIAKAPHRPIHGSDKVARLLVAVAQNVPAGTRFSVEVFNGTLGLVARVDDAPISAMAVRVSGGTIQSLQLLANPIKLSTLSRDVDLI